MRLERYSFCPARRILESASPDIQYKWTFWIHTKVANNAQDFRIIKYGGASNQVASSNPPYDPQSTSNQGAPSDQPYNSQFIKETPRQGMTLSLRALKASALYFLYFLYFIYKRHCITTRLKTTRQYYNTMFRL